MIAQNKPSIDSSCNIAQNYNQPAAAGGQKAANVGILAAIAQEQEQRSNSDTSIDYQNSCDA